MPRKKTYRRSSTRSREYNSRSSLGAAMRRPIVQVGVLAVIALIIFLIASLGGEQASSNTSGKLPAFVNVNEAYQLYQEGTFLLDVRTPEEWNEYHAPNTTLIPLDQLQSRLSELPQGQPIVVVCRSGNRSQVGRDKLKAAGFTNVTSMAGGMSEWRSAGFPIAP